MDHKWPSNDPRHRGPQPAYDPDKIPSKQGRPCLERLALALGIMIGFAAAFVGYAIGWMTG